MEIRIYTPDMRRAGIMENQTSVQWKRRFYEPGSFLMVCPITADNVELCALGNFVTYEGAKEAGIIEGVKFVQNKLATQMQVSGRFLSSLFDTRIINPRTNFSGKVEVAMRQLVSSYADFPYLDLGELQGFEETVEFQATYKNLMAYLTKLANNSGIGYRVRPDFVAKKMYFEAYKGKDHSVSQRERTRVTFSPEFRNLNSAQRELNNQLYRNVCYIGGRGEDADRVFVVVGETETNGLARREIYYDATDIEEEDVGKRPTEDEYIDEVIVTTETGSYTVSHFREAAFYAAVRAWEAKKAAARAKYIEDLKERGRQKLAEHQMVDSLEFTAIPFGNFTYRTDFDLGDVVTAAKPDWAVQKDLRLTEVNEVYEHGAATIETTLGIPQPEKIDLEGMV